MKIELLDNKHVQDVVQQLQRLLSHLTTYYDQCHTLLDGQRFFPIEVDLARGAFTYESVGGLAQVKEYLIVVSLKYKCLNHLFLLNSIRMRKSQKNTMWPRKPRKRHLTRPNPSFLWTN